MTPMAAVLIYLTIGMGLMLFRVCGILVYDTDKTLNRPLSILLTSMFWAPFLLVCAFLDGDDD